MGRHATISQLIQNPISAILEGIPKLDGVIAAFLISPNKLSYAAVIGTWCIGPNGCVAELMGTVKTGSFPLIREVVAIALCNRGRFSIATVAPDGLRTVDVQPRTVDAQIKWQDPFACFDVQSRVAGSCSGGFSLST